jgi:Animal haem peroxidase
MGQSRLLIRASSLLDRKIGWSRLPRPLGLLTLIGLREQLREQNLHGTGLVVPAPQEPRNLSARTLEGGWNDEDIPAMGSLRTRFGRNVPLDRAYPEPEPDLLEPSPRVVSETLLARKRFIPAPSINLLAAAWIQFEVHDWLSHDTDEASTIPVPLEPGDKWPEPPLEVARTITDPSAGADGGQPPVYATHDTHWWDGSQIYGLDEGFQDAVRTGENGTLKLDEKRKLPLTELDELLDPKGPRGNFWIGLALLHAVFMREHNAICAALQHEHKDWSDDRLYDTARLINAAIMAKIHTVEWTPAIIAHPTTEWGMNANWYGLLGKGFRNRFGRLGPSDVWGGIPGSPTSHHTAPYSLTEEFVSVYRMHPLIPDECTFRSAESGRFLSRRGFLEIGPRSWRQPLEEIGASDALYSLGIANPGAIVLHNYPNALRAFKPDKDGPLVDLATIDVLRDRERGVPRYNEFRALLHRKPVSSFEELAGDPHTAAELRDVYGHVDRIDTMVGLLAERPPKEFAFSDTAFRVFLLMASRRLKSDRFYTSDYTPAVYTPMGLAWIENATMSKVLLRHFPELASVIRRDNAFKPWQARCG